jgi:UDP-N-acetylglucosamine/UDP-N-acetylgalactosamine diphosphorylase
MTSDCTLSLTLIQMHTRLLEQLDASGVTSIFQFGVDNVLCHVADPTFVGFCSARHADCASKTVPKRDAHEPVGVVALAGGRPAVVEYSEISREMAEAKDAHGRLLFGDAHICVNFFSVPFLKSFCARLGPFGIQLPLHVAHKKIPYTDASGTRRTPTSNNGIKLELFIFDTFPFAKQMAALQVARDEEFAPVKNEPGAKSDSPDTARALVSALSKRRILAAGGAIRGDAIVELSPMASYQGEGLADYIRNFHRRMFSSASAIFWMYNDCWPTVRSWTTVDYALNRTPSFHPVRRAFAPVNVVVVAEEGGTMRSKYWL